MNKKNVIELCPVCAKSTIDIQKKHKIVWSKELCEECKSLKLKGFIFIGAVEAKTTDVTAPYRSGNVWAVDQSVAEEVFKPHGAPASGISFIDVNVAKQLNLPNVNMDA